MVPWPESKVSTKQMIKHNFFVSKNREYHQVFHASHKTDEPNPLVSLFDSDGLAGEDLAEIDFLPIEADSSAGGDGASPVMEGILKQFVALTPQPASTSLPGKRKPKPT